ncbi:MAG TPA: VanZ family protein [Pyrinomonadaceae bacterium]|nr:VanZ family protein [Pyrinomonadaceae bacterium]
MFTQDAKEQHSTRRRFWRYGPVVIWMGLIWFASTTEFSAANSSRFIRPILLWLFPNLGEPRLQLIHLVVRKAAHFGEYAVLGLLTARAFHTSTRKTLRSFWFPCASILIVIYALIDEYHQGFVASRTSSLYDSGIDVAGGLLAIICFALFIRRRTVA